MQNIPRSFSFRSRVVFTATFALFLTACSGSGIEGRYGDPDGSTVEFLKDGTAIFVVRGVQAVWKWTAYDGNRLKLEPGPGIPGSPSSAICDYQLDGSTLRVTGCDYAMQLTRH